MQTVEERRSRKSSKQFDILMRFYLEERAQNRHCEVLIAFVAFQVLAAMGAIIAASVGKDLLLPGFNRLWLAIPAAVVCCAGLAAAVLLQITAIKHIDRSRWARRRIPWLDLNGRENIGSRHYWVWRFYIAFFATLLLTGLA